ncbi:MAG: tetratricopeptide repeat protein [Candidatus Omnitrophica bacterium]|nr:tetratricopeptide repeat protein [Candidatus Omnitrophota bacterium]
MKHILVLITSTLLILLNAVFYGIFAQEADVIYRQGIEYGAEGKFPEAADWFKENLKNNKSDFTSASSLSVLDDLNGGKITDAYARSFFTGLNFLQNGKIDEGLSELKKTIGLNPGYPKVYNVIGMVYASLGDKTKAIEYFQKAIEINPQYTQACFNLAALYQSLGQIEDALKYYEKVLFLDSNFPEAVMNIAVIYASLGKYSEAIKYYQRAIEFDRTNPQVYYNLALAYFMSDQLVKFRDNLLRAQELYQRKNDTQGLEKVAAYMNKIKDIENKFKQTK